VIFASLYTRADEYGHLDGCAFEQNFLNSWCKYSGVMAHPCLIRVRPWLGIVLLYLRCQRS
jgi:hypothetical protein